MGGRSQGKGNKGEETGKSWRRKLGERGYGEKKHKWGSMPCGHCHLVLFGGHFESQGTNSLGSHFL